MNDYLNADLKPLVDKVYNEGIKKAEEEAAKIIVEALISGLHRKEVVIVREITEVILDKVFLQREERPGAVGVFRRVEVFRQWLKLTVEQLADVARVVDATGCEVGRAGDRRNPVGAAINAARVG